MKNLSELCITKFEIRISKSETISKLEIFEIVKSKTQVRIEVVWHWGFLILFRASDFVLRIYCLSLGGLCAFARDNPSLVAALPRWVSVVNTPSLERNRA